MFDERQQKDDNDNKITILGGCPTKDVTGCGSSKIQEITSDALNFEVNTVLCYYYAYFEI